MTLPARGIFSGRIDRRDWLRASAALALSGFAGVGRSADRPDIEKAAGEMITPPASRAIDRGLELLASRQEDDGSFGSGGYSRNVAVCGLSGMAFMSSGSTPGRGPYGQQVERCVEFILANTQESGFINVTTASSHGPMYGHGFATLFLAESYGMTMRSDIRDKLSKAVNLIINTQNAEGGWRYQPQRCDADISVTIAQVMALAGCATPACSCPARRSTAAPNTSSAARTPTAASCTWCKGAQSAVSRARRPASWRCTARASTRARKSKRGSTT